MAKGHRHAKKLKSERAKVKLKRSTKFLPKGTNVTDTNFKVKQIVVREQLKAVDPSELLSKRKLNIKELLSRLQHYNTTVRTDAITDLKQLVTLHPAEIVVSNLCQLLQGVSHLVLDREKTVRRESLKLIALILHQVSVEQVEPFFAILNSYFRCAMTHIHPAIQEDSLLLLDALLQHVPSLVAANSSKILENFFDLISKLRTDSKPGRTLTVNLGSKLTSVKWRIKVLNRLHHMLAAIVAEKTHHGQAPQTVKNSVKFDYENRNYLPVYNPSSVKPCKLQLNNFTKRSKSSSAEGENTIVKYVNVLVPLLFETWLEVGPSGEKENNKMDVALTEEAVAVLNSILNIFQLLFAFIKMYEKDVGDFEITSNFISNYSRDFSSFVFTCFPYTQIVTKKRKRNENSAKHANSDALCVVENFMICQIFCTFNNKVYNHDRKQKRNAEKLLNYIQNISSKWTSRSEEAVKQLSLILKSLLLDVAETWSIFTEELSSILNYTLVLYNKYPEIRADLFTILCEVVHCTNLNRLPEFQIWVSTLPDLLCQEEISGKTVDMISLLARQRNPLFINALKAKFLQILENVANIKIMDTEEQDEVKRKIISLAYFIQSEDITTHIDRFCETSNIDASAKKYLTEILLLKKNQNQELATNVEENQNQELATNVEENQNQELTTNVEEHQNQELATDVEVITIN